MPDVGPKGQQVLKAYKMLVGVKDEAEIQRILDELDPDQRKSLQDLVEAKGGVEKDITTTEPELGDTPQRLHRKLRMLKSDDEVLVWRTKLEPRILQEVQEIIEEEQMKLADAEAQQELEDESDAAMAYESFKDQFPKPAEQEKYFTTPCRGVDIKYRFRRLKEHLEIDSATALDIVRKDAAPLVVDPDYIRRAWKALVRECGDRQDALDNLVLKHPGSLMVNANNIKGQIAQAKVTAFLIDATSGINKFLRGVISDNGRRSPIGARKEPAFGGGLPAWRRKWEQEEKERKRKEQSAK